MSHIAKKLGQGKVIESDDIFLKIVPSWLGYWFKLEIASGFELCLVLNIMETMSIAKTLGESLETCKHVSLATDSLGHPVLFRFEVRSLAVVRSALFNSLWKISNKQQLKLYGDIAALICNQNCITAI